jgi:hypothetical protein
MHERQTHAHRPRHARNFWRSWLARLEVGFISRVILGAVGALWRLQTYQRSLAVYTGPQIDT